MNLAPLQREVEMTVALVDSTKFPARLVGNGVTTVFVFQFKILTKSDLLVYVAGALKTVDVDYTVAGFGTDAGGTVTFLLGAPANLASVIIMRSVLRKRVTDYQQDGDFLSTTVNPDFDNAVLLIQDLAENISRALQLPITNAAAITTLNAANYANMYLAFDSYGAPTPASLSSTTMTQAIIGALLYPTSKAESDAGVTPISKQYLYGNAFRFMTAAQILDVVSRAWTLDVTTALQNCFKSIKAIGGQMKCPAGLYRVSGRIGTDPTNGADYAHGCSIVGEGPWTEFKVDVAALPTVGSPGYDRYLSALKVIVLEGNDALCEKIKITSSRTINHTADPATQLDPYIYGILGGGKTTALGNVLLSDISQYTRGITIKECRLNDITQPIYLMQAGGVKVSGCEINRYLGTGGVFRDCLDDLEWSNNKVRYGADDCFYAVTLKNAAHEVLGTYAGNLRIVGNTHEYTRAKCIGLSGYSDVLIDDNYTNMSAGGNIVWENDDGTGTNFTSKRIYNQRLKITNNICRDAGRYYDPGAAYSGFQGGVTNAQHAIHGWIKHVRSTGNNWKYVDVFDNTIMNPNNYGIAYRATDSFNSGRNKLISGTTTYTTLGAVTSSIAMLSDDCRIGQFLDEQILIDNGTWSNTYGILDTLTSMVDNEITIRDTRTDLTESMAGGSVALSRINYKPFTEPKLQAITYSASMTPSAKIGGSQSIVATNATAFTINAPANSNGLFSAGQRINFILKNGTGGALGAVTWNAIYKMSAWTQPASGQSRSITFEYDGVSFWRQISQTGVDVPN